jgi:hypothetical protein
LFGDFRSGMSVMAQSVQIQAAHTIRCWHCGTEFDLLGAPWCGCGRRVDRPSKMCPSCFQCACMHPDYDNELFWGQAPRFLKEHGFDRLFYLYL